MRQNSLVAQLPDPPPEAVRVVGILLVVQGLLRLAFLTMLILQGGIDEINIYVVAAALIGAGGVAAGVLALQRFAVARGFGFAYCAICLLYQVFIFGSILYNGYSLTMTAWFLIPAYIAIYALGIVVFAVSPYYKAAPGPGSAALTR